MTPELEELIQAWVAWDEKPGSVDRAIRRSDALKAATPNSNWLVFHRRVEELRRGGLSVSDAITRTAEEQA